MRVMRLARLYCSFIHIHQSILLDARRSSGDFAGARGELAKCLAVNSEPRVVHHVTAAYGFHDFAGHSALLHGISIAAEGENCESAFRRVAEQYFAQSAMWQARGRLLVAMYYARKGMMFACKHGCSATKLQERLVDLYENAVTIHATRDGGNNRLERSVVEGMEKNGLLNDSGVPNCPTYVAWFRGCAAASSSANADPHFLELRLEHLQVGCVCSCFTVLPTYVVRRSEKNKKNDGPHAPIEFVFVSVASS